MRVAGAEEGVVPRGDLAGRAATFRHQHRHVLQCDHHRHGRRERSVDGDPHRRRRLPRQLRLHVRRRYPRRPARAAKGKWFISYVIMVNMICYMSSSSTASGGER